MHECRASSLLISHGACAARLTGARSKDGGLVCGECKVLVDNFDSNYGSCDGYCAAIGRSCTGAWEESGDTCTVKHDMACDQSIASSDAICECAALAPLSPG